MAQIVVAQRQIEAVVGTAVTRLPAIKLGVLVHLPRSHQQRPPRLLPAPPHPLNRHQWCATLLCSCPPASSI